MYLKNIRYILVSTFQNRWFLLYCYLKQIAIFRSLDENASTAFTYYKKNVKAHAIKKPTAGHQKSDQYLRLRLKK